MLIRDGSPTVRNCLFTGNQAKRELNVLAGGLEGDPTFISCQFADSSNGRGVTSSVGGGFVQRSMGAVTFIDCAFTGNDRGGAVVLGQQASFYDCRFAHNIAGFGGGLHIDCQQCVWAAYSNTIKEDMVEGSAFTIQRFWLTVLCVAIRQRITVAQSLCCLGTWPPKTA